MTSVEALLDLLAERGETVGLAESLTGGMVTASLTEVPGASRVVRGAVIAYATDVKCSLLGVDAELLAREGAVHPEVARQLAAGARRVLSATYGVATTGVAGPDPQDGRPVGEVHVAVAGPDGVRVVSLALGAGADARAGRPRIRQAATSAAVDLLAAVATGTAGASEAGEASG